MKLQPSKPCPQILMTHNMDNGDGIGVRNTYTQCFVWRHAAWQDRVLCFGFWTWLRTMLMKLVFLLHEAPQVHSHPHPPATINDNNHLNMIFRNKFKISISYFGHTGYPKVGPIFMGYFCGYHILLKCMIRKIESEWTIIVITWVKLADLSSFSVYLCIASSAI